MNDPKLEEWRRAVNKPITKRQQLFTRTATGWTLSLFWRAGHGGLAIQWLHAPFLHDSKVLSFFVGNRVFQFDTNPLRFKTYDLRGE